MKLEQVVHVVGRVGQLRRGQRATRPVRARLRLVDRVAELSRHELGVPDLRREAEHGCRDLGVEDRNRHGASAKLQHLEVLACGVKDLQFRPIGQQRVQRVEVEPGERIDQETVAVGRDLHEAQLRVIRPLTHEFRVDGEPCRRLQPEDGRVELCLGRD